MNETLNDGYTAIPKDITFAADPHADNSLVVDNMEYGEMNEADARASGYIDTPAPATAAPKEVGFTPVIVGLVAGLAALFLLRRRS